MNRALVRLTLGDFARGLPEYEWRLRHAGSHSAYAIALDKQFARLQNRAGIDLEQTCRVQHNGRLLRRRRLLRGGQLIEKDQAEGSKSEDANFNAPHRIQIEHGYEYAASESPCRWDISLGSPESLSRMASDMGLKGDCFRHFQQALRK
jgi:hypothetical protein